MAWQSQTLQELIDRAEQDFSARFFGTSAKLRRSSLKVLARIWAAIAYLMTLLLEWVYRNSFVHLCDKDQVPLHGNQIGIYQTPAFFSFGPVILTGDPGFNIIQGTIIQDIAGDLQYQTIQEYDVDDEGQVEAEITSLDGGSEYNQDAGTILNLQTPIAELDTDVTVGEDGIEGADDTEDLENTRERILFKKRNPPQGGAEADYIIWVTAQPNITAAYVLEGFPQANSVQIVVADFDKIKNNLPPIVSDTDVQRAQDYVTDPVRKPLGARPETSSAIMKNISISAQISPNTNSTRSAATEEVKSLFVRAIPLDTIPIETIAAAMTRAFGMKKVKIIEVLEDGIPTDEIVLGFKNLPWLDGDINFQDLV